MSSTKSVVRPGLVAPAAGTGLSFSWKPCWAAAYAPPNEAENQRVTTEPAGKTLKRSQFLNFPKASQGRMAVRSFCDSYRETILKRVGFAMLFTLVCFISCYGNHAHISKIKVWTDNFQLSHVIDNPSRLSAISKLWNDKVAVNSSYRPVYAYKIDILVEEESTRWLYDPKGYATVLSIKAKNPIYRIAEPEELSRLLISESSF